MEITFWDSACTLNFLLFFQQSFSKQLYNACTKVQFRLLWYDVPSLVLHHMVCILGRSLAWCSPCSVFLSFLIIIIMIINLFVLYLSLGKSTWRFSTLPDCKGKGQKKIKWFYVAFEKKLISNDWFDWQQKILIFNFCVVADWRTKWVQDNCRESLWGT